jgi:twinfilin-like protein
MIYASGALGVFITAKNIFTTDSGPGSSSVLASRKIETSNPKELNEAYLRAEYGSEGVGAPGSGAGTPGVVDEEKKPFAKPKGPGRRR